VPDRISSRVGGWRSLAARTVRDREAPGSNPGPPTKIRIRSGRQVQRRELAGSQPDHKFPEQREQPLPVAARSVVRPRQDWPSASSLTVRQRMRATGGRDTPVERRIRSLLHRRGLRFRVDASPSAALRSRADIVFRRARVAVYIDGCFWHGCPVHGTWPKTNATWWRAKIEGNQRRDVAVTAELLSLGWAVVRIWEHEDPFRAVDAIVGELSAR
jgi:DNA mismatch endonuclease, patch repair protein